MKSVQLAVLPPLILTLLLCGNKTTASPLPQGSKRTKSDADISAIGHRRIARDTNFYSAEREKKLGKELSYEIERSSKMLNDPTVMEYIDRVAQNVTKSSDAHMQITVRVIDSDTVDASTLPGGYQYISRGLLLRLENEAQLASVLARGIAHSALRSATKEATQAEVAQLATIPPVVLGPVGAPPNTVPLAIPMAQIKLRRDDEFDADYFAVQYVYKAGYDPVCFVRFIQLIWGSGSGVDSNISKTFNRYPPLEERLAALRREISDILPTRAGATVSTPDFDAFLDRLRSQKSEELKMPTLRTLTRPTRDLP